MLEARGLACLRGERAVFAGVSFRVEPGAALLLTGANGAGKSSLLRLLAGLLPPAAGALLWDGEDALADRAAHAGRLRYLSPQDALKPSLTARESLRFASRLLPTRAPTRSSSGASRRCRSRCSTSRACWASRAPPPTIWRCSEPS